MEAKEENFIQLNFFEELYARGSSRSYIQCKCEAGDLRVTIMNLNGEVLRASTLMFTQQSTWICQ